MTLVWFDAALDFITILKQAGTTAVKMAYITNSKMVLMFSWSILRFFFFFLWVKPSNLRHPNVSVVVDFGVICVCKARLLFNVRVVLLKRMVVRALHLQSLTKMR